MKIKHVNHIGINVRDLEAAVRFFTDLGFTAEGKAEMQGELLDEVTGLKDARTELVMLNAPDGQLSLEIITYRHPTDPDDTPPTAPYTHGMQHIAFEVEDLDGIVKTLQDKGYKLMGSVQTYENVWKLCYVYGPEGLNVELAERLVS